MRTEVPDVFGSKMVWAEEFSSRADMQSRGAVLVGCQVGAASHVRLTACRLTNSGAGVYQVSLTVSGSTLQRTDVENVGTAGTESLGVGVTKLDAQYA